MLKQLENLRIGSVGGLSFKCNETERRARNLSLSRFVDIESSHNSGITSIDADSCSGSYLLSGCVDGSIHLHNLLNYSQSPHFTCKLVHKISKDTPHAHQYSVETVQWYPFDQGIFITSGMDKMMKVWDTNTMLPADTIKFKSQIYQHHISPNPSSKSSLVAVATAINQVIVVDLRTGSNAHELKGHISSVLACKWSPLEDNVLVTGSNDQKIMVWDVRSTRNCLRILDQVNGKVNSPSRQAVTSHDGGVNGLCFSKNGLFLLSCGTDNCLRLWNVTTGKNEMVNYGFVPNNSGKSVKMDVSLPSNEEYIYVPSDGYILVYSIHTGRKVKVLPGHFSTVNCCFYNQANVQLYSGGDDRIILCWAYETVEDDCEENDRNDLKPFNEAWSSDDDDEA